MENRLFCRKELYKQNQRYALDIGGYTGILHDNGRPEIWHALLRRVFWMMPAHLLGFEGMLVVTKSFLELD